MPDSFEAYRKQRYRWAYGAMTIMKGHWRDLLPFGRNARLNPAQRYQFLAGWMPWIADGLQLLFVYLAIAWSVGMMWLPDKVEPPLTLYLIVTLGMFFFKVGKSMWLYASKVPCSFARQSRRGASPACRCPTRSQGGVARPLHLQPAVPPHARRWSTSRPSSAA